MNGLFKELIRCAVTADGSLRSVPEDSEWSELLKTARKQSVIGVTFPVIDRLPTESGPSLGVYSKWALLDEKIRSNYGKTLSRARELCGILDQAGFKYCILKGIGTARFYPEPARRQSGDIDIWIEGNRNETVAFFRDRWAVKDVVYHHCDAAVFPDVKVEVHFTPSWMNDPFANRRLQQYYRNSFEKQSSNPDDGLGVPVTTVEFSAVHCLVHIYRHILFEGVGLRQFMDMYFILSSISDSGRAEVRETIESLGLKRCARAVMYVLKEFFGMEEDKLLFEPDSRTGKFILKEVELSGNFGIFDKRSKKVKGLSPVRKACVRMSRLARFIGFAPMEVVFAPVFKTWQYFWRKQYNT